MNKRISLTIVVWLAMVLLPGPKAAETGADGLGIITGDRQSTAYRIGMDLKALAARDDIQVTVYDSSGSVENIYAVYQRPGNHLGLVQTDVLGFVSKVKSDPRLDLIAGRIKWVLPLFDQEVHVIAKTNIHRFSDLDGLRVAIGPVESGTYLTSRMLFELAGVRPGRMLAIDDGQALAMLFSGRIEAMIVVDGYPVERLALGVGPSAGLHLVPVVHDGISTFYPASRIPAGTYAWQDAGVDTVSVKTVLVAYDFRNQLCNTIGAVAWSIREHLGWLQFNGHPKWKTVDLDASVKGWQPYPCVQRYAPSKTEAEAETEPAHTPEPNPVADAIVALFGP